MFGFMETEKERLKRLEDEHIKSVLERTDKLIVRVASSLAESRGTSLEYEILKMKRAAGTLDDPEQKSAIIDAAIKASKAALIA